MAGKRGVNFEELAGTEATSAEKTEPRSAKEVDIVAPETGTTHTFTVRSNSWGLFYLIRKDGGGPVPNELKGQFTSMLEVENAVSALKGKYAKDNKTLEVTLDIDIRPGKEPVAQHFFDETGVA